jgi:hypothetical protein
MTQTTKLSIALTKADRLGFINSEMVVANWYNPSEKDPIAQVYTEDEELIELPEQTITLADDGTAAVTDVDGTVHLLGFWTLAPLKVGSGEPPTHTLIRSLLQALTDLDNGYPWKELGVNVEQLTEEAKALGIELDDDEG